MKKSILLSTLALLAIFALPIFAVTASVGQDPTPMWQMCTGSRVHGNIEIGAALGQNSAVISWSNPATDWELDLGRCYPIPFMQSSMTVYVNDPAYRPVPTTVVCHSSSCTDGFALLILHCNLMTKYGCTQWVTKPYNLKYGDSVVAELSIEYISGQTYFGTYALSVTS